MVVNQLIILVTNLLLINRLLLFAGGDSNIVIVILIVIIHGVNRLIQRRERVQMHYKLRKQVKKIMTELWITTITDFSVALDIRWLHWNAFVEDSQC